MPYITFRKVKHKDRAFSKLGHGGKSNAEHIGNTAAKIKSYTLAFISYLPLSPV